jgi:hypothetical protein
MLPLPCGNLRGPACAVVAQHIFFEYKLNNLSWAFSENMPQQCLHSHQVAIAVRDPGHGNVVFFYAICLSVEGFHGAF